MQTLTLETLQALSSFGRSIHLSILRVNGGSAFVQGVFGPFGITEDDDAQAERKGGFGSTGF